MIHHVGLEVQAHQIDAVVRFWELLGWQQVAVADGIDDVGRWLQLHAQTPRASPAGSANDPAISNACGGQQVHLQVVDQGSPAPPTIGHVAVIDPLLDATAERLAEAGFEVLERTRYWGARRVFTRCPAGHRVELMSAPPANAPATPESVAR